jgi:RNA polymerase Rpb4
VCFLLCVAAVEWLLASHSVIQSSQSVSQVDAKKNAMELVDGDSESPTLISNVEVMELLQKNLGLRATIAKKAKKTNKRNNKQFRHRDWVEEEVHRYLCSTPCVNLDPHRRQEFHSILKSRKHICQTTTTTTTAAVGSTATTTADDSGGGHPDEKKYAAAVKQEEEGDIQPHQRQSVPSGFGLTEAETLQIMNMMPTKPVEIHLMVDELQSRMTETRQEEFLAFIASYCKQEQQQPAGACNSNNEETISPVDAIVKDEETALQPNAARKRDVSEKVAEKWLKNGNRNGKQQPSAVDVKQEEEADGDDPQTGLL